MGLGKTVTLIALHLHRLEPTSDPPGPTLVVCPASLLGNWEAEIARFAPGMPVRRFHGSRRYLAGLEPARQRRRLRAHDLRHHAARPRVADSRPAVPDCGRPWGLVVADEAQHVKNPASATARALRAIPAPPASR